MSSDARMVGIRPPVSFVLTSGQEPLLFKGTIRENLDPSGDHSDFALWQALRRSRLTHRRGSDGRHLPRRDVRRGASHVDKSEGNSCYISPSSSATASASPSSSSAAAQQVSAVQQQLAVGTGVAGFVDTTSARFGLDSEIEAEGSIMSSGVKTFI